MTQVSGGVAQPHLSSIQISTTGISIQAFVSMLLEICYRDGDASGVVGKILCISNYRDIAMNS